MSLLEHGGFRVGETVKLNIPCSPKSNGKIKTIWMDSKSVENPVFTVSLKNEDDRNQKQDWAPVYLNELVKV